VRTPEARAPSSHGLSESDKNGFVKLRGTQPFEDFVAAMGQFFRIGRRAEDYASALAQADAVTEVDGVRVYLFRLSGYTFAREGPQGVRVIVGPRTKGEPSVVLAVRSYVTRR